MKKVILTIVILFSLTGIANAAMCSGMKPMKPMSYCSGTWKLECVSYNYNPTGNWGWVCVKSSSYYYGY